MRSRACAMLRMKALVSALILRERVDGMSPPSDLTGEAAPMVVPGAMTAKLAAAVMKVPADAARAPAGPTIYRDGDVRCQDFFDNLTGRFEQAAGGVQLDDHQGRSFAARLVDSACDAVGGQGFDIAVDLYDEH